MSDQSRFAFARDETVESPHQTKPQPYFEGPADEPDRAERLGKQLEDIRDLMLDGAWRTLDQIHERTGHPVASISAQLRHLRKARFGSYRVSRRHVAHGLYEYQVLPPEAPCQ